VSTHSDLLKQPDKQEGPRPSVVLDNLAFCADAISAS